MFYSKLKKTNEKGRSLIEVIAVLAIVGILLISALVGLKLLFDYLKYKETAKQITTIGVRYKSSRLQVKDSGQAGRIKITEVYPEAKKCAVDSTCAQTADGGQVKLYKYADSTSFIVLSSNINPISCQEVAYAGGFSLAIPAKQLENDNTVLNFPNTVTPENINPMDGNDVKLITDLDENVYAFTPDYLKKNPSAIKKLCDTGNQLFVYGAGKVSEDCAYFYGGKCHNCPENKTEDRIGQCCDSTDINCGLCGGCQNGRYCKDDNRCVECINNTQCTDPAKPECVNEKCVECRNIGEQCTNSTGVGLGTFCNENHECVPCDETNGFFKIVNGLCECQPRSMGETCSANCNCSHLGITAYCKNVDGVKRCSERNGCTTDEDCSDTSVCCQGVCCPSGQICEDGICKNCSQNSDCESDNCCNQKCCPSDKTFCCNGQCCASECVEVNGVSTCGGCSVDEDCPENYYCDAGICRPCLHDLRKSCGEDKMDRFNKHCYEEKHLDCFTPGISPTVLETIRTPICVPTDDEHPEEHDTCQPCETTQECQNLGIQYRSLVCRTSEATKGTCGPCEVNEDCPPGILCMENGLCGCETDVDCEGNIDGTKCLETHLCGCQSDSHCLNEEHLRTGQTKCVNGTCQCDDGLQWSDELLMCVCSTAEDFWTRVTNDTDNNQVYICCPRGQTAKLVNGEYKCIRICEANESISVALLLDYSYSTYFNGFDGYRNTLTNKIIQTIEEVNEDIQIGIFREDNKGSEENEISGQKCMGNKYNTTINPFSQKGYNLDQSLCAYNCTVGGRNGQTCFSKAQNEIKSMCGQKNSILFFLSDGVVPANTVSNTGCCKKASDRNCFVWADQNSGLDLSKVHSDQQYHFTVQIPKESIANRLAELLCAPEPNPSKSQPQT